MYEAFDPYLARENWYTGHSFEDQAFYACLQTVVDHPDFSPETMRDYLQQKVGPDDEMGMYYQAIEHRVTEANGIRDFLRQTGR